jgi:hypothetical protein
MLTEDEVKEVRTKEFFWIGSHLPFWNMERED